MVHFSEKYVTYKKFHSKEVFIWKLIFLYYLRVVSLASSALLLRQNYISKLIDFYQIIEGANIDLKDTNLLKIDAKLC